MKEKSPYLKKKGGEVLRNKEKKSCEAHQRDKNRLRKIKLLLLQAKKKIYFEPNTC